MPIQQPFIPEYITVHLGRPDQPAENITIPFDDYIKNVASSEIYPTWPEAAIRANILAQTSFALNRIFTEWYPSQGYDFDITNSTAFDQSFVPNRDIFDTVSDAVDELFGQYIRRGDNIEPLFAAYCDGIETQCEGLSQTATVALANQGLTPLEILQYFYGNDINIVENTPVQSITPSFRGSPISRGDVGGDVLALKIRLNRISQNYPAIPRIPTINGLYDQPAEDAVRRFQEIFGINPTGVVDKATWYRIAFIFNGVKRLAELNSEGLTEEDLTETFPTYLRRGDTGDFVRRLQLYLAVVSQYNDAVRPIEIDSIFGPETESAVRDFQQQAGLDVDGIVGPNTWRELYNAYRGIVDSIDFNEQGEPLYPGEPLSRGSSGNKVTLLQNLLLAIAESYPDVPRIEVDGEFGPRTEEAVRAVQRLYGLEPTGVADIPTWEAISSLYSDLPAR